MTLESFVQQLFLYGGIAVALLLIFWNKLNDFFFQWIEPHPDKALYLQYEKTGRKIAQVYNTKTLERARLAVSEFEVNNKHDFTGQYYTGKLQNMLRQKELKLSVDLSIAKN